jgi:hypothetical protein
MATQMEMFTEVKIRACRGCGRQNVPGCPECFQCRTCGCACIPCAHCGGGKRHAPWKMCRYCGACKKLCSGLGGCRAMPKVVMNTNSSGMKESLFHANPLRRTLGLEIELSNVGEMRRSFPRNAIHWKNGGVSWSWVHDGSITAGGEEMVVNPMVGDIYVGGMARLTEALLMNGAEVDTTCGLHVHVGAREDIGMGQLKNIFLGYLKIQDDVYRLVAPERKGNRFCRLFTPGEKVVKELEGLSESHELKEFFFQTLYGKKTKAERGIHGGARVWKGNARPVGSAWEMKAHKYQECRYYGLNFHSWMQRGTVEWRHCEGTLDPEKLMFWPLFCGWTVEVLQGLREDERCLVNGLSDLVNGEWKRPYKTIAFPKGVRDWVLKTLEQAEGR